MDYETVLVSAVVGVITSAVTTYITLPLRMKEERNKLDLRIQEEREKLYLRIEEEKEK
jgi:pSer/pThr/pTyr-binding forkhead associated (FHA) protein